MAGNGDIKQFDWKWKLKEIQLINNVVFFYQSNELKRKNKEQEYKCIEVAGRDEMSSGKLTAQRPVALLLSLKTRVERHITYHAVQPRT